jgi:hypothetical protein
MDFLAFVNKVRPQEIVNLFNVIAFFLSYVFNNAVLLLLQRVFRGSAIVVQRVHLFGGFEVELPVNVLYFFIDFQLIFVEVEFLVQFLKVAQLKNELLQIGFIDL